MLLLLLLLLLHYVLLIGPARFFFFFFQLSCESYMVMDVVVQNPQKRSGHDQGTTMRKNMWVVTPRCAAAAAVVSAVVLRRPTKEYTHPYSMMHRRSAYCSYWGLASLSPIASIIGHSGVVKGLTRASGVRSVQCKRFERRKVDANFKVSWLKTLSPSLVIT